jgi:perosamine synthetase
VNAATPEHDLAGDIIVAIRSVVGPRPAVLHEPRFAGNEWAYLKE